jgi:hypothetical protein
MRPKFVALLSGITIVVIVGLSFLRWEHGASKAKDSAATKLGEEQAITNSPAPGRIQNAAKNSEVKKPTGPESEQLRAGDQVAGGANSPTARKGAGSAEGLSHEDYVEKRVGELSDLGMTDDPEALKTILSEIKNTDTDIRKAAIEAAKQFGSADALPKLEEALSTAETTSDKQDLQDAIEFLKLPSFLAKRN